MEIKLKEYIKRKKKLKLFLRILLNHIFGDKQFRKSSLDEILVKEDPWTLGYWLLTVKTEINDPSKKKVVKFVLKTEKKGGGWRGKLFGFSGIYGDPITTSLFLQSLIKTQIINLDEASLETEKLLEFFPK